jgi:hypothetical protein
MNKPVVSLRMGWSSCWVARSRISTPST